MILLITCIQPFIQVWASQHRPILPTASPHYYMAEITVERLARAPPPPAHRVCLLGDLQVWTETLMWRNSDLFSAIGGALWLLSARGALWLLFNQLVLPEFSLPSTWYRHE